MHQLVQMTEIINAWAGQKNFVVETETVFIGSEAAQGIWKPKQKSKSPWNSQEHRRKEARFSSSVDWKDSNKASLEL